MHLPHGPGLTKLSFPCYRVCVCVFGSVSDFWLSVCLSLVYESVKISITTIDNNRESLVMPADCVVWSLCGGGELIPQTAFSVASAVWVCVCVCVRVAVSVARVVVVDLCVCVLVWIFLFLRLLQVYALLDALWNRIDGIVLRLFVLWWLAALLLEPQQRRDK